MLSVAIIAFPCCGVATAMQQWHVLHVFALTTRLSPPHVSVPITRLYPHHTSLSPPYARPSLFPPHIAVPSTRVCSHLRLCSHHTRLLPPHLAPAPPRARCHSHASMSLPHASFTTHTHTFTLLASFPPSHTPRVIFPSANLFPHHASLPPTTRPQADGRDCLGHKHRYGVVHRRRGPGDSRLSGTGAGEQ